MFRDLDLELRSGDRLVLSGPSGTGKSTLLRSLVLLEAAEGELRLDGSPVGPHRVLELRRRVAYVPQRPVPVAPTLAENLALPRTLSGRALDEEAQAALLRRLGVSDLPGDRRFDRLSGGEQQRVALVRSLTPGPDLLLLDEPTASLDPENVADVVGVLTSWVEADPHRALVWVTHQTEEIRTLANRHVTLEELQP